MDLSNYPECLVRSGTLRLNMVIGEKAPEEDVISAIEVAANLQETLHNFDHDDYSHEDSSQVGLAVLDKDVTFPITHDLLVFGLPAHNKVTLKLLNEYDLSKEAELKETVGKIILVEVEPHIVIFVFGGSTKTTNIAARVLANAKNISLRGKQVEIHLLSDEEVTLQEDDNPKRKIDLSILESSVPEETEKDELYVHAEEDSEFGINPDPAKILNQSEEDLYYNLGLVRECHTYPDQIVFPAQVHASSDAPGAQGAVIPEIDRLRDIGRELFDQYDKKLYELICHRFDYCTKSQMFKRTEDVLQIVAPCVAAWMQIPHGVAMFLVALVIKKGIDGFCGCKP